MVKFNHDSVEQEMQVDIPEIEVFVLLLPCIRFLLDFIINKYIFIYGGIRNCANKVYLKRELIRHSADYCQP